MSHPFAHSMTILRGMRDDLPPLIPEPTIAALQATYEQLLHAPPQQARDVEDAIIAFGRILWPYRKAFEALVREVLDAHHEVLFTKRLDDGLRTRFQSFIKHGGSLSDLHDAARASDFFNSAELGRLCTALLDAHNEAEERVRKAIAKDDAAYMQHVQTFQALQHEIEQHLSDLRRLATRASGDETILQSILESIREFERGFARLAKDPEAHEVCAALETHRERHEQRIVHRRRTTLPSIFR
ncbi:MAG: hypothetical protein ABIG71_01570 [Candidatus Uhrbacteria bacterium]